MQITLLKSKLHRLTTTHSELDYEGSCAIDSDLLKMAGIREYEQIQIYNVNNGERFTTYAILGEAGSGICSVNGAAAHKAKPGDLLIIATYATMSELEAESHKPKMLYFNDQNQVTHAANTIAVQTANIKEAS